MSKKPMHTHFLVNHALDGSWEWVFIVRGKLVARSSRTFRDKSGALRDAKMMKRYAGRAEIDTEL